MKNQKVKNKSVVDLYNDWSYNRQNVANVRTSRVQPVSVWSAGNTYNASANTNVYPSVFSPTGSIPATVESTAAAGSVSTLKPSNSEETYNDEAETMTEEQVQLERAKERIIMVPTINEAVKKEVLTKEDANKYLNGEDLPDEKASAFNEFCQGLSDNREEADALYNETFVENEKGEKVSNNPELESLYNQITTNEGLGSIVTNEELEKLRELADKVEETEEADEAEKAQENAKAEEAEEAEGAEEAEEAAEPEGEESPEHAKGVNDTKVAMRAIFSDLQNGDVVDIDKHPEILADSQRVELYNKFIDDIMEDGNLGKSGKSNLLAHCGIYAEAAESAKALALKKNGKIKVKDAKSGREGYIDKVQDNHDEKAKFDIEELDKYK